MDSDVEVVVESAGAFSSLYWAAEGCRPGCCSTGQCLEGRACGGHHRPVAASADVNKAAASGATPVFMAAFNGHVQALTCSIEAKGQWSKRSTTAYACPHRCPEWQRPGEFLLDRGKGRSGRGDERRLYACLHRCPEWPRPGDYRFDRGKGRSGQGDDRWRHACRRRCPP